MLIERKQISDILSTINKLKEKKFDIQTQYKMIKIEKAIRDEQEIFQEQIKVNCSDFFERNEKNEPIMNEDGGFKIKKDCITHCYNLMNQLMSLKVQIPDIYFSLDELTSLDLSLGELASLEPFIKI